MEYMYVDRTNKISDDDILKDVLHVKNDILKKETIILKEYCKYGNYGSKAIKNHFGTWNKLLEKLKIKKTRIVEHLTKEDIFCLIEDLWNQLSRQPTLRQFESMSGHTKKIIISRFGKWSDCTKEFCEWKKTIRIK